MQRWPLWGHLSLQSRQGLLEDTLSDTVSWDPGDMVALGVQGACAVELPLGTSRLASFQQAEFLGESQVPQPPQGGGAHPPRKACGGGEAEVGQLTSSPPWCALSTLYSFGS